jgi:opacity protein-like surface antigen
VALGWTQFLEGEAMKKYVMAAAMVLALSPASARADWLFTPSVGTTFGGDTNGNEHFTYGAAIGWMGAGVFGFEADLAYTPEFFESSDGKFDFAGGSNVVTAMLNTMIGFPERSGRFRPYITGGIGMLQTEARSSKDLFTVDNSEFGFNVGAGAMGFLSEHVGLRGDLRYMRSLEDPRLDNEFDIATGNFDYWRGSAGVTLRW